MTYISPQRQFITSFIQALKDVGVTVPILTMGYNDDAIGDYIYLHVNNSDESAKNAQQNELEVYVEIISIDAISISSNLTIEEQAINVVRSNSIVCANFDVMPGRFVGSTTNVVEDENKRYFQNVLRMTYMLINKNS